MAEKSIHGDGSVIRAETEAVRHVVFRAALSSIFLHSGIALLRVRHEINGTPPHSPLFRS